MTLVVTNPEIIRYTNALGDHVDLDVGVGATGRMAPPVLFWEDSSPGRAGTNIQGVQYDARTLTLPCRVPGPGRRDEFRTLMKVLNPALGTGFLQSVTGDSTDRLLECMYIAGMDVLPEDNPDWATAVLQFRAFNPFWSSINPLETTYNEIDLGSWFPLTLPLMFPAQSSLIDVSTVDNVGDVEAWPYVTFFGPGSGALLANLTTDKLVSIGGTPLGSSVAIGAGDSVRIDMRPGIKTVTYLVGATGQTINWYPQMEMGSEMWSLQPGINEIFLSYTTKTGSVVFGYVPQYLSV